MDQLVHERVVIQFTLLFVVGILFRSTSAQCPQPCTCNAELAFIYCDNASLTEIPSNLSPLVQHLSLRANNISFLDNNTFQHLPKLQILDLSDNPLTNISSSAFLSESLYHLVLIGCGLEDVQLGALTGLKQLQHLSLAGNNITDLNSLPLNSFTNLHTLDLSYNTLRQVPGDLLSSLLNLTTLELQGNAITALTWNHSALTSHPLRHLNLSHNGLEHMAADSLTILSSLEHLDVRHNSLANMNVKLLGSLGQLSVLWLGANPLAHIPNWAFSNCSNLQHLQASAMPNLTNIPPFAFEGLVALKSLNLSNNPSLEFIHPAAFNPLSSLETLDLSQNHLETLFPHTFQNLTGLKSIALSGNPWSCDCDTKWLHQWVLEANQSGVLEQAQGIQCSYPERLVGTSLVRSSTSNFTCDEPHILNHTEVAWFQIGSQALLDCVVSGTPRPVVTWITPRRLVFRHHRALVDHSQVDPEEEAYHSYHPWHETQVYIHQPVYDQRITILPNGSLYIDYVTRADAGPYTCIAENYLGNDTVMVNFKLKYLIKVTVVESIIVGFGSAFTFFLVTVVIAAIRYVTFWCSAEERNKRKGIREVLETIQDYKSAQFDKLKDYKQAKVEQISAYKSAKLGQLSAFKTAKIDKIRTYKQMTVTNVIFHMQRMREHYTGQVAKIKDNCSKQVEKLQENYCNQMGKFKDYKSYQVDRIRENYQSQVMKIREYGSDQLKRLRDQYKMQQLHIMKLLELLDIGNCMHVIEAECIRTESMIFDPNITFDLEAKPVHICLPYNEESGNSDYLTASSEGEGSVVNMPYILSMEDETITPGQPSTPKPGQSHCQHTANKDLPNVSARVPMLPIFTAHLPKSSQCKANASANPSKPAKHHRKHRTRTHNREGSDASVESDDDHLTKPHPPERRPVKGCQTSRGNMSQKAHHQGQVKCSPQRPADLIQPTTLSHGTLPAHLREMTPGMESISSNTETEYESARESRDQTPEFCEANFLPTLPTPSPPITPAPTHETGGKINGPASTTPSHIAKPSPTHSHDSGEDQYTLSQPDIAVTGPSHHTLVMEGGQHGGDSESTV